MDVDAIIRTLAVVYLIVSVNLAAYVISRVLRGAFVRQVVRPPFYSTYLSVLALLTAGLYLVFYAFKDDYFKDYSGAIGPLIGLMLPLFALIVWSSRRAVKVSARGLEVQYVFITDRIIPWKEVVSIGRDVLSGTLVVNTLTGRKLSFSDTWDNLDHLWETAQGKQVTLRRMDAIGVGEVAREFKSHETGTKRA